MSDRSKIEWCDATWNPVTGCTKVSAGCKHCYAERFAERFRGVPGHPFRTGFDVTIRPERFDDPLAWRKPRRVFVCSMSDLFHRDVPDDVVDRVLMTAITAPRHTYLLLTKRAGRLREYFTALWEDRNGPSDPDRIVQMGEDSFGVLSWPLPNVWIGVSVENQEAADARVPLLLETPATKHFVSIEPLLGPVVIPSLDCLDWVIVGGESGPKARPMDLDWARSIRDQCREVGVPFFFKQIGGRWPKSNGRLLDGRSWNEMPTPVVAGWAR